MLRFLFGTKPTQPVKVETQRETFKRLVEELNDAIAALPVKPKLTIDTGTGAFSFETPEQFPDEALALPAPAEAAKAAETTESSEEDAAEKDTNTDAEKEKAA